MRKIFASEKGFTMLEIIISLALFSIFAVAFSGMFSSAMLGVVKSGHQADAAYRTQQELNDNIADGTYSGTQTLTYNFSGGPTIDIVVNTVEADVTVGGSDSEMNAFVRKP